MRRGRRLVAPAPTGDPWGYYAECRESHHMEADRTIPETSTQPCTESSTEAMDTDEGTENYSQTSKRGSLAFNSFYGTFVCYHRRIYVCNITGI